MIKCNFFPLRSELAHVLSSLAFQSVEHKSKRKKRKIDADVKDDGLANYTLKSTLQQVYICIKSFKIYK